ncbi:MAG: hypothetical protein ABL951_02640 [Alphaproteobacteria bacterium]
MKPLAIDLCCGLFQTKLLLRTNPFIKQLVAGWAKHPDHMPVCVCHYSPCAISLIIRSMRHLKDASLTARFACRWQIRVASADAGKNCIPDSRQKSRALGSVRFHSAWISTHPQFALFLCRLARAPRITVTTIRSRWNNIEVYTAFQAVRTLLRNVSLFVAAKSSSMRSTPSAAPFLVWANRLEFMTAITA